MEKSKPRHFHHRRGALELGERTRLMGIVNVTPDSLSDGGRFLDSDRACEHALKLAEAGAEILDLGAESTRPGSKPVSVEEQLERLLPLMELLRSETDAIISIDTRSPEVARNCLALGADVINDISGLRHDVRVIDVCAEYRAGIVVMHMQGEPATMQTNPQYSDVVSEVKSWLADSVNLALNHGISADQILVDPGLGFGKSFVHNYHLLHSLESFRDLASGVLVGPSRKAFTGEFSGLPPAARQYSTAATVTIAILKGADVLRVHDVAEMRQVSDICDRYLEISNGRE
jgi:dihydropteroate synthase